ncbi:MAG TPA: amidase [Chloroflexota bacterium]|nr:amidase [Chloroflexota bacterium]
MSDQDLAFAGVAQLGRLLREQRVSSYELAELFLTRLATLGPSFNAVASLTPERALAEARKADTRLRRSGVDGAKDSGNALLGIPYGAKDLLAARGASTTWGAPPYRDQVFAEDAAVVEKLKRAGAVLAAKLAMVELAGGGGYRYPSASLHGPGLNPWNREYWAGGSSSGSGAAVAAGLVPWAIGSETSGSIITPASFCGVTGLRPTYGLVSRRGAMALSWTLDKLGPMARSAEDCALALEVMAGPDRGDQTVAGKRFRYLPAPAEQLRVLRIGFAPADFEELAAPDARAGLTEGLTALRGLGAPLLERALPPDLPYGSIVSTVIFAEGSTSFARLIESDRFEELIDAKQKAGLRAGLAVTARDYLDAMRVRSLIQEAFRGLFRDVNVLVSGGRGPPAGRIGEPLDIHRDPATTDGPNGETPPRPNNASLIAAGNLAGLPALCIPCGFSPDGLPLALQLVGPPFSENLLLSLGAWFQSQTDWHRKQPPLAVVA